MTHPKATYTAAELEIARDAFVEGMIRQQSNPTDELDHTEAYAQAKAAYPDPDPPRVPTDEDRGKRVRAWDVSSPTPYDPPESDSAVEGVLAIRSKEQGFYIQDDSGHIHQRSHAELIDPPADKQDERLRGVVHHDQSGQPVVLEKSNHWAWSPINGEIVACGVMGLRVDDESGPGCEPIVDVRSEGGDEFEVYPSQLYATRAAAESARETQGEAGEVAR
ncbi:MAG: hypothetical protein AAFY08_13025 [Planctomycetota bacterium]